MKNSILFTISITMLGLLFSANITFAQTASGKIIYTIIEEARPTPKSINGVTFRNGILKARLETDDNSGFHKATGVCEDWVVPTGGGNAFSHGVCIFADKDGDTFVTYITSMRKDEIKILNVKGGTGKFIDLDGKGTSFDNGPADTGKVEDCCIAKWEISY